MNIKQNLSNLAWGLVPIAYGGLSLSTAEVPSGEVPYADVGEMVRVLMLVVIIVAGLAALAFLIIGGLQYITSGGDKLAASSARDKITFAIIGLAIVVGAYAIAKVLEVVFGVSIVSGITWPGAQVKVGGS